MPSTTTNPSPSTTLTTETDLSILYRILRTVIKPLRPRLTQPGKPLPGGSPQLTNHPKSKRGCKITETRDPATKLWLYNFSLQQTDSSSPPTSTSTVKSKHKVLYFAGGGFQSPPASEHWSFVSTLASHPSLSHIYDFTLVSYPLAPNSPATASLPVLQTYLRSVIEDAAAKNTNVSLMGDSSGGNIAFSLGFWWSDQLSRLGSVPAISVSAASDDDLTVVDDSAKVSHTLAKRLHDHGGNGNNVDNQDKPADLSGVLINIFAISPAVDMTNSNPEIKTVDKFDPVLGAELTSRVAKAWTSAPPTSSAPSTSTTTTTTTGTTTAAAATQSKPVAASTPTALATPVDPASPIVSPVHHPPSSFTTLAESAIRTHGVIGTHDVLGPDAEVFRRKCVAADVRGDWLIWERQMHCFVLAGVYGMKEGRKGTEWCVGVLERNAV